MRTRKRVLHVMDANPHRPRMAELLLLYPIDRHHCSRARSLISDIQGKTKENKREQKRTKEGVKQRRWGKGGGGKAGSPRAGCVKSGFRTLFGSQGGLRAAALGTGARGSCGGDERAHGHVVRKRRKT